jgi:DNA polymerase-3 subunit delta'
VSVTDPLAALAGIDAHPHARAVLAPALEPRGVPSHAYLFHGPAGTGKRSTAQAFAAGLLARTDAEYAALLARIERRAHPDVTWVRPSGAAEMLVSDIEEPVVSAATRTPFESARRVFVIEAVDTMNDQAANRMLKTLEEPPAFVHLLLLTDRLADVMPTIASRCQHVRFDPLAPERIAQGLGDVEPERAQACARLALGDAGLAKLLASDEGSALRASAEAFVRSVLAGLMAERPWVGLLEASRAAGARAGERAQEQLAQELELVAAKERKRYEREALEARRRGERRVRTRTLDRALALAELWLRDVLCICEGVPELIHAVDRRAELEQDVRTLQERAGATDATRAREAIELVAETRLRLTLHVSEELALEALACRLEDTLRGA